MNEVVVALAYSHLFLSYLIFHAFDFLSRPRNCFGRKDRVWGRKNPIDCIWIIVEDAVA